MAEEKLKTTSVVRSPQILALYSAIDPELPMVITKAEIEYNRQEYKFAQTQGSFGFLLGIGAIGGAVYLAMHNHDWVAGTLLGAGAVGMVTGFQYSRLTGTKKSLPDQPRNKKTTYNVSPE